ncbi:MAG: HelD family protein, partial [Cellulosilyticaceae bacterium]
TKGRLTEIVATIQDQQNKIIRSDAMVPLIVQGVAGSGKTTIALHRMAYMIYNQKRRDAQYMVVAPNKLFLNYIEAILPDLGVDDVYQTTFEEWAVAQLGKKIKLSVGENKLNQLLTASEQTTHVMALAAKLRGSIVFKKLIDLRVMQLERGLLPEEGLVFEGVCVCTRRELGELFFKSHLHLPLQGRIKQLGETLKKRLRNRSGDIEVGLMMQYQRRIIALKEETENIDAVRQEIIAIYDERDAQIKTIKKRIPAFVKDYLSTLKLPSAQQFYGEIFEETQWLQNTLQKQMSEEEVVAICSLLKMHLDKGMVESEDLGPLLYCQMKLYGLDTAQKFAHIVVDEAQDLDEMKLTALRQVSIGDAFTLVGDLSQGIYDYKGITDWERMMSRTFEGKAYHYYEMTTSYRSTIEIIALANHVIASCQDFKPILAEAVLRHGDQPQLVICEEEEQRITHMRHSLGELREKGHHSIGILVETKEQAAALYQAVAGYDETIQWIQSEEDPYEGGLVIMTGELSKGLEFDAVIIYDVTRKGRVLTSLDMKLLYVMTTRALHELHLYSIGSAYDFLEAEQIVTTVRLNE